MKKICLLLLIVIFSFLIIGCSGVTPNTPGDEYDEQNTQVSYIKVTPASTELSFGQSKKFEVKAYNSENKLVAMDASKIKWTCTYECIACGVVCNVSPVTGSAQTTFKATNPEKTGSFEVWANYDGKWAKANVTVN